MGELNITLGNKKGQIKSGLFYKTDGTGLITYM